MGLSFPRQRLRGRGGGEPEDWGGGRKQQVQLLGERIGNRKKGGILKEFKEGNEKITGEVDMIYSSQIFVGPYLYILIFNPDKPEAT